MADCCTVDWLFILERKREREGEREAERVGGRGRERAGGRERGKRVRESESTGAEGTLGKGFGEAVVWGVTGDAEGVGRKWGGHARHRDLFNLFTMVSTPPPSPHHSEWVVWVH